jgi:flavorubredoxin
MSSQPTTPYAMEPYRIAEETYVLPHILPLGPIGSTNLNALVVRGKEPIVVDTSASAFRGAYLDQLWSLVDPKDVRWIYISHDDNDHVGNLAEVLEMAPNAQLITTGWMAERLSFDFTVPLQRMRWVNDGEKIQIADRTLYAVRPPIFDSPVTRGMFDSKTGVFWGGDSFGTIFPEPVQNAADVPAESYRMGFHAIASLVSPWHLLLDQAKYERHIERVIELPINVIASAHGPATYRDMIPTAVELLREMPQREEFPQQTQRDLDAMIAGALVTAA